MTTPDVTEERRLELLKNASDCFDKNMSPFSYDQLSKLNVTSTECLWLSDELSSIITRDIGIDTGVLPLDYIATLMNTNRHMKKLEEKVAAFGMDYVGLPAPVLKMAIKYTDEMRKTMGFAMNFLRLDTLRQITGHTTSEESTPLE